MEPTMTDLAALDPALDRQIDPIERRRSEIALDAIIAGTTRDGRTHRTVMRRAAIGVAAVAVAVAGALAVPALLPSAADKAFAAWTATPTPIDPQQVLPAAKNCVSSYGADPSGVTAGDVVLSDQRGIAISLIVKHGADALECMSVEDDKTFASQLLPGSPLTPPNGLLSVDTRSSYGSGDTQYSHVVGFTTAKVTGIDLILADGRTVHTSTADGWWTAWWPGPEAGEADTIRVVAHTAGGGSSEFRIAQLSS
ncbi:hypothetical protein JIG36_28480 [Actinoplanes sp. LDG1-06]|uniref:Uncharacterized protein n=1 Tax=Paractinoplanes ovalisporus TaxID=2810368 RepID=A0ABS2AI36_9ACTN|nr:hypothetical protein [Actinoplanes ovalisporus]MBM2619497.1 hypothetical protein [Actinoplanes ovalisporus]